MKILVAVDGSKTSLEAVDWLVGHAKALRERPAIELLTVHEPISKLARFGLRLKRGEVARWYRGQGEANLQKAKQKLRRAGLKWREQIHVGSVAQTIVRHAARAKCDLIVLGTSGMGAAESLLAASVAAKVLDLAKVPVLLAR
jgi:nucleotide-binding universal stress UspA family protein